MEQQLKLDSQTNNEAFYVLSKRILDVSICLITLIVLSPIFIIVPIMIKLDSKGPAIFKQVRIGKNNKPFYIYKFRSMRIGTPSMSTNELTNSDCYITSLGKFLRKTSIDELPQIFNVLKGDMSVVGPRPVIDNEIELLRLREECKVNTILPGITGLAQIRGRDFVSLHDKVEYDHQYLVNRSIIMDVNILLRTFIMVLKEDGIKSI